MSSAIADKTTTRTIGRVPGASNKAPAPRQNYLRFFLVGLIAVFLVIGFVRMSAKAPEPATVMIVAAAKDLPPGCRIGYRDLHYMNVPKSYFTPDMIQAYPDLVGAFTTTFIAMGEPITRAQLLPEKQSLESQLTADRRALTLKLNDDALVDHTVCAGDHVDLVATTAGAEGKKYTKTICQDVLVLLAIPKEVLLSDKLRGSEQGKITLSLAPADVEKVTQASESSKLRLVLRNKASRMKVVLSGADDRDLLPHEALRVQPPVRVEKEESASTGLQTSALPAPPPPLTAPAADVPENQQTQLPAPLGWVVEVFKGATKESQVVGNGH